MPGFSFKKQNGTDDATNLTDAKVIIYDDGAGNKYTFGVNGSDIFDTFKYESGGNTVDYSALATQFMTGGGVATLLGKLTTIDTNVNTISTNVGNSPLAPMFTGLAQQATLTTLDGKVGLVKDKTDNLDPTATTDGTLGKVLSELAKANQLPDDLTDRLNALDPADTSGGLGATLKGIKDKTDKLDLTDATAKGTLAEALGKLDTKVGLVKDKTEKLDLTDATATGTLAEALGKLAKTTELDPLAKSTELTLLAKANQLPSNLTTLLSALDLTDATAKGTLAEALGKLDTKVGLVKDKTEKLDLTDATATGTLAEALGKLAKTTELDPLAKSSELTLLAKANQLPDDLTKRLDALNLDALNDPTDNNPGTLGEALEAIQLETGSMSTNLQLLTALLKGQLGTSSAGNNEDMLGKYAHDEFLG